jgi:hypothetical protein
MITKVTIQPVVQVTDPSWIALIKYTQSHPFTEMSIRFKEGRPFEAVEVKESLRF